MDLFFFIFVGFVIFVLCSMCGFCCRNKEREGIYTTPVVVTSETHQVPRQTIVTQHTTTSSAPITNMPLPSGPGYPITPQMPMPYQPTTQPYPPVNAGQAPYYPPTAPHLSGAVLTTALPAPYPKFFQEMNSPPSYNEAVNSYPKQQPYNPGYPAGQ